MQQKSKYHVFKSTEEIKLHSLYAMPFPHKSFLMDIIYLSQHFIIVSAHPNSSSFDSAKQDISSWGKESCFRANIVNTAYHFTV